jgi:hypothetical protein
MTRFVLWLSRHPALAERVIQVLHKRPAVFQLLMSANMGQILPGSPQMMGRLVRHLTQV